MHFHMPKPVHGWREFIGEVGIIVLGVLIALAAEQMVEAIHWRHEVDLERESLLAEAQDALLAVRHRQAQQPCVDKRLSELHTVLDRHRRGQPFKVLGLVGQPTRQDGTQGTWEIAVAGQALAHMSHDEKLRFSGAFGVFELWEQLVDAEADAWARLAPLSEPELLSEQDWSNLRTAYWEAKLINERKRRIASYILRFDNLGLRVTDGGSNSGFEDLEGQICRPLIR